MSDPPARPNAYFFSDLHLRPKEPERSASLIALWRQLADDAHTLYLVGDVFDFWLGWRDVIPSGHFAALQALRELVDRGVRVVLFSGNHDPDPGAFFAGTLGVEVRTEALFERVAGRQVWIEHGDTIDPRGRLRRVICKTARSPLLHRAARALHPALAFRAVELYARRGHRFVYDTPLPSALTGEYLSARAAAGADVVVLGHYHRAVVHHTQVDGRSASLFVLGDWLAQRTYLRANADGFTLLRDRGPLRPPAVLPPGDHSPNGPVEPPRASPSAP